MLLDILTESKYTKYNLYFLSNKDMDCKTLTPRIPNNYFTENGYEDNTTKRVCFSNSINKCLMALSSNIKHTKLYVYVPIHSEKLKIIKPTTEQVPDKAITGEVWVTTPVTIKCIGEIYITDDDGKDGYEFKYGDNIAKLYGWKYKWIKKY